MGRTGPNVHQKLQRQFWQLMRATFAEANTQLVLGKYTDYGDWMNCEVGIVRNRIRIYLNQRNRTYRVMAHLDGRKSNPNYSHHWFQHMLTNRSEIERVVGVRLDWAWENRTGLVEVEIFKQFPLRDFSDQQTWLQLISVMRQQFKDFKLAFEPHMQSFVTAHGYLQHDGRVKFAC